MDKDKIAKEINKKMDNLKYACTDIDNQIKKLQEKKKEFMKEFNRLFDELRNLKK